MSWVFLVGDQVFKLKKDVRHPFLDFSTLARRKAACREELRLNERLAPGVYRGLLGLQWRHGKLALVPEADAGRGTTLEWLVWMRRLPRDRMLDHALAQRRVGPAEVEALTRLLSGFYRDATRVPVSPHRHFARFQQEQASNRAVLALPHLRLHAAVGALDRFDDALQCHRGALASRVVRRCIVDGHGDLRPEHVCLIEPPVVIDRLEFNAGLRAVDPYDELAFLSLECTLAGAPEVGGWLVAGCAASLGDAPEPALMHLYTAGRALLRARLAIAHLLDPQPRLPERWQPLAQRYIAHGLAALDALDALRAGDGEGPRPGMRDKALSAGHPPGTA